MSDSFPAESGSFLYPDSPSKMSIDSVRLMNANAGKEFMSCR
jgi:hypothetical protein